MFLECSKCDINKPIKNYRDTKIKPIKGVLESKLDYKYCNICENYTQWFLGKGVPDKSISKRKSLIESINYNESKIPEYLNEIKKIENSSFINRYKNRHIIKNRKENILYLENEIPKLEIELKNLKMKISESINFYEKHNPNPKCLECGNDNILINPIHPNCGGNLIRKISKNRVSIMLSDDFLYEYDENGNCIKTTNESFKNKDDIKSTLDDMGINFFK